ncbi:MAG: hypothetical protein IPK58_07390 [Acidobacteria bacterium]|nr:hypothetical protein [Acidobacteriota bacterium]
MSETQYLAFDAAGRVLSSKQLTDGAPPNPTLYSYNLSGAIIEETYPSGRVVRNTLDADGDLMQVQSSKPNQTLRNYANGFTYTAARAVSAMRLGNGKWESTAFNSRLQPTRIGLGGSASDQSLLKLDYTYGVVENNQLNTAKNNGNIQSQTITVPDIAGSDGFTAVQTYSYDSLNRIDDAKEVIGSTEIWKQDYTFDRFGNRNFVEANTTTIPRDCFDNKSPPNQVICDVDRKMMNPSVNASNNRLSASDGYQFDAAGNTVRDPQNRKFTYDAENKQTKVETVDANGNVTGTIGEYFYDGDGRRVEKIAWLNGQSETTVFVYDASSRLVAEYSTNLNPAPQVAYLTNDHLGSPRINTNENGAVISRHDYRAYGEEIIERTHTQYLGDTIRKQFTGYERDNETDLDFARNRYNSGWLGRFSTPDPFKIVAEIEFEPDASSKRDKLNRYLLRPLQWNAYVYVVNNPLKYTDPTGEVIVLRGTDAQVQAALKRMNDLLGDERFNLIQKSSDGRILYLNDKDICGGNFSKFSSFGPTDKDKDVSKKFAEMLASPTRLFFGIATTVQYIPRSGDATKIGTMQSLDIRKDAGGGVTLAANESISGEIEIWVAPNAADAGNRKASAFDTSGMTEDGSQLSFPDNSVVDSHEFGHGYDLMFNQPANTNSLIFENARRANVKNNQRRKSEK